MGRKGTPAPGPETVRVGDEEMVLSGIPDLDRKRIIARVIKQNLRKASPMSLATVVDEQAVKPALEQAGSRWRGLFEQVMSEYLSEGILTEETEKLALATLKEVNHEEGLGTD